MTLSTLRLESFTQGTAVPDITSPDVERARQEGYQQGQDDARIGTLAAIGAELERISAEFGTLDAAQRQARTETVDEVAPILAALVDLLAPLALRDKLAERLTREIRELARPGTPQPITIRCPPEAETNIRDCLTATGIAGITLETGPPGSVIEIGCAGARTRLDAAQLLSRCHALIRELTTEE